jgi:serine/threonine protein phosphatase PrpC
MEDGLLIEEDIGGSEWKLISLFAVFDGHGGPECMEYVRDNLIEKIKAWSKLLDEAGDLNEMIKILMNKTFFELDYEFYQKYPDLSQTCGATGIVMLIIESKVYTFSLGDCKGYTFRNDVLFQLNLDHLPVFLP